MPQPNKIPLAFAASGDKNTIPENTETTGLASWREGFPAITSAPFSEGGIAPKRADFNGIFNALSQAVMWMQQGGVYAYDVNTDYEAGNVVLDAGGLYVANSANGPSSVVVQPSSDTTGATWKLVRLDLATQSAAGYMSGADKTKLDGLISTDATPTAAGYMSAADKALLDSVPEMGTYNKMFTSRTSGNYIAPRSGVYRITIKGGGGGGSYQSVSAYNSWTGAGGGEGGTLIFYKTLTKDQSYPYAIGAGGAAGTGSTDALSPGQSGGASNFNNSEYVASGGSGAPAAGYSDMGGDGGHTYTVPTGANAFFIPGQTGQSGYHFLPSALPNEGYPVKSVSGGGQTARYNQPRNNFGEGGNGGGTANPTAGGSGFILIEYAG